jgi:NAD-dependent deacetylase
MSEAVQEELLREAARRLAAAGLLVVFTGAGISRESGIATFRDKEEGLWARYDPLQLATLEGYLSDPPLVWEWYEHRFGIIADAEPNPGHAAIAELERLLPQVVVVTQNIDGLHHRAGSTDVIELHGSMHRYKCLSDRHTGFTRADFAGRPEKPPRCPRCGGLLRPDVVWFGEALPESEIGRAFLLGRTCDAMLVVGTSGVVQPAASVPVLAARAGALVIDVNPERDDLAVIADIFLRGRGGEVLPRLVAAMKESTAQDRAPV